MSVIIRLQNLPWSANAMDIRNFFRGLSIPEGGVHIVGGEQGDAFIAFSTDEDARQGMLNNGGRIKEVQVKLLLSSRSEMLKVIETARQAVTFMQMASQPALPAQPVVTQPSAIPTSLTGITGILAQNLKQLQQVPGLPLVNAITNNISKPLDQQADQKDSFKNNKDSKFDRRRSRSSSRDRHKKDRGRDGKKDKRDRSRSRDRSRDRDRRRRDRSRSRERRDRKRDRKDRSRDRDRSKDRSDRFKDDKKNDISKDTKPPVAKSVTTYVKPVVDPAPATDPRKRFGGWSSETGGNVQAQPAIIPNTVAPYMNQNASPRMGWNPDMQQMIVPNPNIGMQMPNPVINKMMNMPNPALANNMPVMNSPSSMDEQSRITELVERRNPNAFQVRDNNFPSKGANDRDSRSRNNGTSEGYFGRGSSRFRPNNYNNRHDSSFRNNRFKVSKNSCLKVSNLSDRTLYKDIRRFFTGLFIPNSGLKLINNQYGRYTGIAYVRFSSPEDKFEALKRSGRVLNGSNILIEDLDDEEYDNALDLFVPNRSGMRDSPDRGEEDMDSSQDLIIVENDEELTKDKTFNVLYLEDLPPFAKEQDIMKMFSDYSLLSILLLTSKDVRKQYVAYVQFVHANDAKAALTDKSKHLIGHIAIKVSPCSDSAYEQAKQDNAEQENVDDDGNTGMDDAQGDHEMDMEPSPPPPVHRDPRQRRMESKPSENIQFNNTTPYHGPLIAQPPMQPGMFWRPNNPGIMPIVPNPAGDRERVPFGGPNHFSGPPQRPSRFHAEPVLDCIFIKGLPLSATDKDVLNLFADLNVTPTRIHLMLTLQGEPSGDCFCEFTEASEASAAVTKNGDMVGINRVSLELVPKSVVNDALGIPNNVNNYAGDVGGGMGRGGYRGGRGGPPRGRGRGRGGRDFHSRGGRGGYGSGPPPVHSNEHTEGFGSPGTVVSMENVPYRATINEILDFFHGFNVSQQDLIRRFNENGQPTGDARVNLHTTFDAQKAVSTLNMSKMRDRTITLSILHSN